MANTPPPPNPAPQPNDGNASNNQGGIDRDVNSILANLNHEQLASIVAAAVSTLATKEVRGERLLVLGSTIRWLLRGVGGFRAFIEGQR